MVITTGQLHPIIGKQGKTHPLIQPWSCREAVKLPGLWQAVTWGNKEPVKARQVPARVAVAWLRSCKEWLEAGNREWRKLLLLVSDNIFYNSKLLFYFYAVAYKYKTTKHRVTIYIILYIYYIPYPHLEICLKEGNWDVGTPMQPFHKLSIIEPVPQIDTIWSQHPYWIVVSDSTIQVVPRTHIHSPFTVPLKLNMSWWLLFFVNMADFGCYLKENMINQLALPRAMSMRLYERNFFHDLESRMMQCISCDVVSPTTNHHHTWVV